MSWGNTRKICDKIRIQFGSGKIIFIIILFFFNYAKIPRKPTVYFHTAFAQIGSSTNKLSDHLFHLLDVKLNNLDIYDTKYVNHYIRQSTANSQTNVQHSTILTSASCHFMSSSCSMLSFSPPLLLPKIAWLSKICTFHLYHYMASCCGQFKNVIYRPCFWCFMWIYLAATYI